MDLQSENEPLIGSLRALSVDEETLQLQPQPAGPRQHDAPPSDAAVHQMGVVAAVATLRAHVAVAKVAEKACERLNSLCRPDGSEQAAAEAGAIEAVMEALRAHPQAVGVHVHGLAGLTSLCVGANAAGRARAQRAADAGAIEVVVVGMRAHVLPVSFLLLGCMALINVCSGDDAAGRARKQRAADAGALEAVVAAMRAHPQVENMQRYGCGLLLGVCGDGASGGALARRQRAAQAGGRTVAIAAMQAHPGDRSVQDKGQLVLNALPA